MSASSKQLSALSRLFSSTVIRELSAKGKSGLFARLIREADDLFSHARIACVRDAFDFAFDALKKEGWRDEYVYRAALTRRILMGRHNLKTASMLSEFRTGSCKADLVILNGTSTVYEIKSERDSLTRLERQIESYRKVFASVVVIAAEAHVDAVLSVVPDDVGVMSLSRRYQISTRRDPVNHPGRICPATVFDALQTSEIKAILVDAGEGLPDVPNTRLRTELRKQFTALSSEIVHAGMLRTLKRTRDLAPLENLVIRLPISLHAAALSMRVRKSDHQRLLNAVDTPFLQAMSWS